jgi:hypothetical protein
MRYTTPGPILSKEPNGAIPMACVAPRIAERD